MTSEPTTENLAHFRVQISDLLGILEPQELRGPQDAETIKQLPQWLTLQAKRFRGLNVTIQTNATDAEALAFLIGEIAQHFNYRQAILHVSAGSAGIPRHVRKQWAAMNEEG